ALGTPPAGQSRCATAPGGPPRRTPPPPNTNDYSPMDHLLLGAYLPRRDPTLPEPKAARAPGTARGSCRANGRSPILAVHEGPCQSQFDNHGREAPAGMSRRQDPRPDGAPGRDRPATRRAGLFAPSPLGASG